MCSSELEDSKMRRSKLVRAVNLSTVRLSKLSAEVSEVSKLKTNRRGVETDGDVIRDSTSTSQPIFPLMQRSSTNRFRCS